MRASVPSRTAEDGTATLDEALLASGRPGAASAEAEWVARIAAEISAGFRRLAGLGRAVSVFGSHRIGADHPDYELGRAIAAELGRAGFAIMTGAGPGIMEAANRGAHEVGAPSIGLNIELPVAQPVNGFVDVRVDFKHFFARKLMFVRYASACVFLPGGYGTLDELFESLTLIQTNKIRHFPVVLAGRRSWGGLLEWLRRDALAAGRLHEDDVALLRCSDDPAEIRQLIEREVAPADAAR